MRMIFSLLALVVVAGIVLFGVRKQLQTTLPAAPMAVPANETSTSTQTPSDRTPQSMHPSAVPGEVSRLLEQGAAARASAASE